MEHSGNNGGTFTIYRGATVAFDSGGKYQHNLNGSLFRQQHGALPLLAKY